MSEFEAEVKKAEKELEQGLVPVEEPFTDKVTSDEFLGDLKMQAQEYGQQIKDAAGKAYDFASDKFTQAGDKVREEKFKVFGNCNECKTRIESTLKIKEVKFARWDKKSKELRVAFLQEKITLDSLHHLIASVGHDTEKSTAPDSVYASLPGCCLYRGGDNTH